LAGRRRAISGALKRSFMLEGSVGEGCQRAFGSIEEAGEELVGKGMDAVGGGGLQGFGEVGDIGGFILAAEEEPVLSNSRGPDAVLDEIVADPRRFQGMFAKRSGAEASFSPALSSVPRCRPGAGPRPLGSGRFKRR
jgi:hypothetical protein